MKSASSQTLAILATGQYLRADLYQFSPLVGGNYYFTSNDVPLTVSAQAYGTGLIFQRDNVTQKIGLDVITMNLTISPQYDSPNWPVMVSGLSFIQACQQGILDGAAFTFSKLFLNNWNDTSPGAVTWFQGMVNGVQVSRQSAQLSVDSYNSLLNVQMPRNVYQTGCTHTVYDTGCTLSKATFQVSGTVTSGSTVNYANSNLTQVDNYFNMGVITFTSGANNGLSRTVKSYSHSLGQINVTLPWGTAPSVGDTFTIVPGCPKTQAACSNTSTSVGPAFNNIIHFRGYPYIPVPETLYDGGTNNPTNINPPGPAVGSGAVSTLPTSYQS